MRFLSVLLALVLAAAAVAPSLQAAARPVASHPAPVPAARDLVLRAIGVHKLVLLGEMHGTVEAPALAAALLDACVARGQPVSLGLEIPADEQRDLDRYVASGGRAPDRAVLLARPHWQPMHDGRDSEAMFALVDHVRRLQRGGAKVAIVAFDHCDPDMNVRNRRMAQTLRDAALRKPGAMLLVLTGNIHAMTHRPSFELIDNGKPIAPPMTAGRYLADLSPVSFDVQGASGAFHACLAGSCGMQPVMPQPVPSAPRLVHGGDSAWDYDLLLPHFTPSPPAIMLIDPRVAPAARAVNP